nr:HTF4a 5'-region hypothetical 13K protein - human [Homo sapiens]
MPCSIREREESSQPALSLALSTRDRGWYISASASGDWGGWLNARMLQFCSVKGLSLNQVMVDDAGVPLMGSYIGVMVLLYKPGLTDEPEAVGELSRFRISSIMGSLLFLSFFFFFLK